jgi:hypothetical protein
LEPSAARVTVGFKVLPAVLMKSTIFWDMTPCSPLKVNRRFYTLLGTSFHAGILLDLFDLEKGGDIFLQNVDGVIRIPEHSTLQLMLLSDGNV